MGYTMEKKKIVVFMPAHNEERNIGAVISRVPRFFHPEYAVEVVVINDGSKDNTVVVAKQAGADYIVSFEENRGLGAAVREGLAQCCRLNADIGLMIDADN
jgi:glycosyltransferase involved in cell wall biosynthesis